MFLRLFSLHRARTDGWSRPVLLCMGLLDELIMGIPIVALPLLRDRLGLSYAQVGLLFTAAALSGMLIEPFINLLSDRRSKKSWILWGLLLLTAAFVLIGNLTSYVPLLLAFAMSYPAGEAAINLSQAVIIDAAPNDSPRTMTRWTLLSSIGDFLAPLVVSTFVALHLGWLELCALWLSIATLVGVLGLLVIHTLWMVIIALLVISASCSGWYPLAMAEAYARKPARSGVVRIVIGLGNPFEMALPGAIGLICASFGIFTGLSVLGLAPVLMLILLPHRRGLKH